MARFLQVVRDLALLLARVGLGWILVMHGWRRWQDFGIDSQIAYLKQFGTPFPEYAAWGGTILEMVGGVFLIVGALTPLVAALIVAEQVLIIAYTSWYKHLFLTTVQGQNVSWQGGYEYNVIIGLLALLLLVFGGGRIAVDQLFRRTKTDDADDLADAPSRPGTRSGSNSASGTTARTGSSSPAGISSPTRTGSTTQATADRS